ncbi:MAG: hypothetical protein IJO85_08225 [Lachnospiraceae bacterium]|nr:hypothetical protein [Lachnospiraceae bacterium]
MKQKKKLAIGIAIEVLFILLLLVFLFCFYRYTNSYKYHLELAQKYLLEENYEQAIAEYKIAISIDPAQKYAYEELADIYFELEVYNLALEILESGFVETEEKGFTRKAELVKEMYVTAETESVETVEINANTAMQEEEQVNPATDIEPEITQPEQESMYVLVTNKSKEEVEKYAKEIKQLFLERRWNHLAEEISYPIEIDGTTYASSEDFIQADFENKYDIAFIQALEAETCESMYCDSNGIRLGNGEVWSAEVENALKVTDIHGHVDENKQYAEMQEEVPIVQGEIQVAQGEVPIVQEEMQVEQEETQESEQALVSSYGNKLWRKTIEYHADGSIESWTEYIYYSDRNIMKEVTYDSSGNVLYYT